MLNQPTPTPITCTGPVHPIHQMGAKGTKRSVNAVYKQLAAQGLWPLPAPCQLRQTQGAPAPQWVAVCGGPLHVGTLASVHITPPNAHGHTVFGVVNLHPNSGGGNVYVPVTALRGPKHPGYNAKAQKAGVGTW